MRRENLLKNKFILSTYLIFVFVLFMFLLFIINAEQNNVEYFDEDFNYKSTDIEYKIYICLCKDNALTTDTDDETGSNQPFQKRQRRGGRRRANRRSRTRVAKLEEVFELKTIIRYRHLDKHKLIKKPEKILAYKRIFTSKLPFSYYQLKG